MNYFSIIRAIFGRSSRKRQYRTGINQGDADDHPQITYPCRCQPRSAVTPEQRLRSKLLDYLADQQKLASPENGGAPFNPTKKVTRTDEAGNKIRVDAPRHIKKGWFSDPTGKHFFHVRYAGKPLELAKGMNAVAVQDVAALPMVIGSIIDAVNAGELDAQLKQASAERKANFKPRARKAT